MLVYHGAVKRLLRISMLPLLTGACLTAAPVFTMDNGKWWVCGGFPVYICQPMSEIPTVDLSKLAVGRDQMGVPVWSLSFQNLDHGSAGTPYTLDVTVAWDGGSSSRSIWDWYANTTMAFGMDIPFSQD